MEIPSVAQVWSMVAGSVIVVVVARLFWLSTPPPAWKTILSVLTAIPFFGFGTGSHVKMDLKSGNVDIASLQSEISKFTEAQATLTTKLAGMEKQISEAVAYPYLMSKSLNAGVNYSSLKGAEELAKYKNDMAAMGGDAKWVNGVIPSADGSRALLWGYVDKDVIQENDKTNTPNEESKGAMPASAN